MGLRLEFIPGRGPVFHNPVRSVADVRALQPVNASRDLAFTLEAIRLSRERLNGRIPLIGFSGAPFTLACYAIEGATSREYASARRLLYEHPDAWDTLMTRLTDAVITYLLAQRDAGADLLQVFDSWVGLVSPATYQRAVQPHMTRLFAALGNKVPVIHFGTGNPALLPSLRDAGGDVIGLDWRCPLTEALPQLEGRAIQGNLDPAILLASTDTITREVTSLLDIAGHRPGYIFNLGHGVFKQTPEEHVRHVVDLVRAYRPGSKA
jgi:uroporphyrinogen decarboxylase